MASLGLALTKTAVEGTLSLVKLAIEEEKMLKVKVQNDLLFITGEFQMMQSFLNVASKERAKNEVVQTWVRQVRSLAFDVEDCVEFVIHLDRKSASGWLRRFLGKVFFCAPPLPLDVAIEDIRQLKARVEDVSQRNTRYSLISDSSGSASSVPTTQAGELLQGTESIMSASAIPMLRKIWADTGRCHGINDLKSLVTCDSSDRLVITVCASAEAHLEATSIFRKAYYDPEVCQEFKFRAWVSLVNPFNPDEFLKSMLTQFRASSRQQNIGVDARTADEQLMQKLMEQSSRYLVVLDHFSAMSVWDIIQTYLPDCRNGSRILMSTHDIGIALLSIGEPYQVSELRRFSNGHSITAFFKKLQQGSNKHRSDVGELKWQIKRRGVFSVLGTGPLTMHNMVYHLGNLYNSFKEGYHSWEECDGAKFEQLCWIALQGPIDVRNFAENLLHNLTQRKTRSLHQNYQLHGEEVNGIGAGEIMEEADPVQQCCNLLRGKDCLIFIIGLKYTDDWDKIKSIFLSELNHGSCIIVVTDEANLAKYCADHEYRVLGFEDVVAAAYPYPEDENEFKDDTEEITDEEDNYFYNPRTCNETNCEMSPRMKEARRWLKKYKILSRDKERRDLWRICKKPPRVLSVWGIAGVGKSALVRDLYYRKMLRLGKGGDRKFYAYSWVDVPQPFNLMEFSWRLLVDFHSDDLQAKESALIALLQGQDPSEWCCKFLRNYKCLVVIDGLQSKEDWNSIKAAFFTKPEKEKNPTHACIVVITNEESVATYCADVLEKRRLVVNVKGLEDDVAFRLFKKTVAWHKDRHESDDVEEHSRVTVTKCGGLPKIVVAIGKYIKRFNYHWVSLGFDASVDFMVALETYPDPMFTRLRGLFLWMQHYFDSCSDALKPCIFYLPVFPSNKKIRRKRLLRRWIAEGYSRDAAGLSSEDWGDKFFNQLIELSIIQVPDQITKMWKINGFFYEYIISRPLEDNLVMELEGQRAPDPQRTGQHLTLRSSWARDEIGFQSIDFSRLRSLTVYGAWKSFFITRGMKHLRVLDLEDTLGVTNEDVEQIGKMLSRLKFLSIRGCIMVSHLPNSFGGMKQLQTLDVRRTSIVSLPCAIVKLQKLQYIRAGTTVPFSKDRTSAPPEDGDADAYQSVQEAAAPRPLQEAGPSLQTAADVVVDTSAHSCSKPLALVSCWLSNMLRCIHGRDNGGVAVPSGIERLMLLHTLGVVNVSGLCGMTILKELAKLPKLRKLGLSGINRRNIQQLCCAISDLGNLESLSIRVDKEKKGSFVSLDAISQPPKTLKSLKLYGHIHGVPLWVQQLVHLKKLDLETAILRQEDIHVLGMRLPPQDIYLRLCVKPTSQHGSLKFGQDAGYWPRNFFSDNIVASNLNNCRVLRIDCTSSLQVTFANCSVHLLIIHCSSGSSLEISGLKNIYELKEVWLKGFYSEALMKTLKRQIDELPEYHLKPELMLEKPPSS